MAESFYLLLTHTDLLVLQQFRSPEDVAIYYAAAKTLALVAFIYFSIAATTAHRVSAFHAAGDREGLAEFLRHAIRWTFWPSLAATALLLAFGKPILALFGPQFTAGYHLMFILAVGLLARAAIGPMERFLNVIGQQRICALVYGCAFARQSCALLRADPAVRRGRRRDRDLGGADLRDHCARADRQAPCSACRCSSSGRRQ